MYPAWFARILAVVIFLSLAACGGGGSSSGGGGAVNAEPIAHAGNNQNVKVGDTVLLDGTNSYDEDGDALTYQWRVVSAPGGGSVPLVGGDTARPTFVALSAGEYVLELIVNDGAADSEPVTVSVTATVANSAPVADAGSDQSVKTGSLVTLDGRNSSDVDGDSLTYQWAFVQRPQGSTAQLGNARAVTTTFTPDLDGVYVVGLVVSDGALESDMDEVAITAATPNSAPVAHAGSNQTVTEGDTVTLDGSRSADADGDLITYAWHIVSKPEGSAAVLVGADTVSPTFTADLPGVYVFGLVVDDGELSSAQTNVTVTADDKPLPPIAVIQEGDYSTILGATLNVRAATVDPNGTSVGGFTWELVSKPEGSQSELIPGRHTSTYVRITYDTPGYYVIGLTVWGNGLKSEQTRITVTVAEPNYRPVADAGENQHVNIGDLVFLDGTNSYDDNADDTISYAWTMTSRVYGSNAVLMDTTSPTPSFTPDRAGDYVFRLIVNDGQVDSLADTVTITAVEPLVDGLRLEVNNSGSSWSDIKMPYISNGTIERTTTCVGTCPTDVVLATYRVTAIGGDYTVSNVDASVLGTVGLQLNPYINGLHTGQLIVEGQTVEFTLEVARVQVSGIDVQFAFDVVETGNRFEVNRKVTLN